MANTILHKRSSTANAVPTTAALASGALAINTNDGRLFLKKTTGGVDSIVEFAPLTYRGWINKIRNADFRINQRGVSGTVSLGANAYGHDGVKAGASGATYTFSQSGMDVTLNILAGTIVLPMEANLIEGGDYRFAHQGNAQARVWQGSSPSGSYAAAPFTATGLTAVLRTNVEFSTGTVLLPQFERGTFETPFERRPYWEELAFNQRYYYRLSSGASTTAIIGMLSADSGNQAWGKLIDLPVEMRADGGTVGVSDPSHIGIWSAAGSAVYTATSISSPSATKRSIYILGGFNTSGASFTAGQALVLTWRNGNGWIDVSTEI